MSLRKLREIGAGREVPPLALTAREERFLPFLEHNVLRVLLFFRKKKLTPSFGLYAADVIANYTMLVLLGRKPLCWRARN